MNRFGLLSVTVILVAADVLPLTVVAGNKFARVHGGNDVSAGQQCFVPDENPKNLEYGEVRKICAKTEREAVAMVKSLLDNACAIAKEELLYLVKVPGGYELRRGDLSDGTNEVVPFNPRKEDIGNIVAIFHNHPEKDIKTFWPSEADVTLGFKHNSNVFVRDCKSNKLIGVMLRDPNKKKKARLPSYYGKVHEISDNGKLGREIKFEELEIVSLHKCDGSDPYDESQLERYKADRLSESCGTIDRRKGKNAAGNVEAKVKQSASGGYCGCTSPIGCVDAVVNERADFAAHMGRKARTYGSIQFICGGCGKINLVYYNKAKKLRAEQQKQGMQSVWFDRQLQAIQRAETLQSSGVR